MITRNGWIRHMVVFCLHHPQGSSEEIRFLEDGRDILGRIPGVLEFEVLRQVSAKCDYDFGFSMVFESQAAYDAYSSHPKHNGFVEQRWSKEVSRFQEIDLITYK
jgi:hypothetical protein